MNCPSWLKSAEELCANQALRNAKMSGMFTPPAPSKFAGQQAVGFAAVPHAIPAP